MSGQAPRSHRHRAKRYGNRYKDRIEKHKKARVMREWKKAQGNPDNDMYGRPPPTTWKPASATRMA